jgi:hypothetical protein
LVNSGRLQQTYRDLQNLTALSFRNRRLSALI